MKVHFTPAKFLSLFVLAASLIHSDPAQALRCEHVFRDASSARLAIPKLEISYRDLIEFDAQGLAFAKGSVRTAGKEFQFGFESEYMTLELSRVVDHYGPAADAGLSKETWLAMPASERLQWVQAKSKSIPFGSKDPVLVRLDKNPDLDFLPSELIRDDTGNVEFVLPPVSKFETWERQLKWINRHFGTGSMQAMVSQPKETFFPTSAPLSAVALKENKGYFNAIHEADVLSRMAAGAEKYNADNSKEVLRPFLHPYLGPMVQFRHKKMIETLEEVSAGKVLNAEETAAIIKLEHSFKYVGSNSYRPDIAGATRASQEARDAHKDEALLIERAARTVFFGQKGRGPFIGMANIKVLDTKVDFEKFPREIQDFLKTIFPVKSPKKFEFEKARLVHETYRNFAYPLKSWRPTLQGLDRMDLVKTVSQAQEIYVARLAEIHTMLKENRITVEQARADVQGALANFALDSRLHEAFVKFQNELPRKMIDNAAALAIPRRSLELRLASLMSKWPNNIKVMPGVTFKYKDPGQKTSADRDVLLISTEGLSAGQLKALEQDYLDAVTMQTLTFPLKERASHTLVQFEGTVYNFGYFPTQHFSKFRIGDYKAASSRRIEPIILLNRFEERNMRDYIQNIKDNKKAVLGKFNLEGDPNTNGRLTDNKSPCGNNCTTWITRAPIGKNQEALVELMGGEKTVPWIQQNPGWFGSWAVATAKQERMPFVALWTPKSLAKAMKSEFTENSLTWDFNRK